jgi:hypothetical protein
MLVLNLWLFRFLFLLMNSLLVLVSCFDVILCLLMRDVVLLVVALHL